LIAELQAAGIPTDALDEGQLSGVKRLKDLGLSLPEIREALPEPPGKR
jgi:DNA-binding transcriptional MerR regulator